jgi:hypothetical protein
MKKQNGKAASLHAAAGGDESPCGLRRVSCTCTGPWNRLPGCVCWETPVFGHHSTRLPREDQLRRRAMESPAAGRSIGLSSPRRTYPMKQSNSCNGCTYGPWTTRLQRQGHDRVASFAWRGSGVAVGLGAGGFFAIYPCSVFYIFDIGLGSCFTTFESVSASCRTAASAHGSSTGCSADGEEEWEVCGGGGWRGGHG